MVRTSPSHQEILSKRHKEKQVGSTNAKAADVQSWTEFAQLPLVELNFTAKA